MLRRTILLAGLAAASVLLVPVRAEEPAPEEVDKLPGNMRLGDRVRLHDGRTVRVYLWSLPDSAGDLELVYVPRGNFTMGSNETTWLCRADGTAVACTHEQPRHTHPMGYGYWIGRTDVTWRQFRAFVQATDATEPVKPRFVEAKDDHPVSTVTWKEAKAFCDWAHLVLPTEAEWEKAARGTDGRTYPWGDEWSKERANFYDASCPADFAWKSQRDAATNDGYPYTSPVGSFPKGASFYGALDMAGNVWEWCADVYDEHVYGRYARGDLKLPEPSAEADHVTRGGSWASPPWCLRTSCRDRNLTRDGCHKQDDGVIGFRAAYVPVKP